MALVTCSFTQRKLKSAGAPGLRMAAFHSSAQAMATVTGYLESICTCMSPPPTAGLYTRPACRLAGSKGMVALSAAVHITGFCACEFAAKAQNSSVAKIERFLILRSIGRVHARTLANSRGEDYEGTKCLL